MVTLLPKRARPSARHLARARNGTWQVRLLLPAEVLRLHPGLPREWRKSTGTGNIRCAAQIARAILPRFYSVVAASGMADKDEITKALRGLFGTPGVPLRPINQGWPSPQAHSVAPFEVEYHTTGRIKRVRTEPHDGPEALALVQQLVERDAQVATTLAEGAVQEPRASSQHEMPKGSGQGSGDQVEDRSISLAVSHYIEDCLAKGTHSPRTATYTLEPCLRLFVDLATAGPDARVSSVTPSAIDQFVSDLRRFPARQGQRAPGSAREVLAAGGTPISRLNAAKKLRIVLAFVSWLLERREVSPTLVGRLSASLKGMEIKRKVTSQALGLEAGNLTSGYIAFTPEELNKIFNPVEYIDHAGTNAARYWIPIIGRYTGLRINEISAALVSDVRSIENIWCLCVTPDEGAETDDTQSKKRVKTAASVRAIPLHDELIRLGFVDYVSQRKKANKSQLFDLKYLEKHGYGKYPGRDFQILTKRVGVWQKRKKVFHSFRATISQELEAAGLDSQLVDRYLGHSVNTVRSQHYSRNDAGLTIPLKRVHEILNKLGGLENMPKWRSLNIADFKRK